MPKEVELKPVAVLTAVQAALKVLADIVATAVLRADADLTLLCTVMTNVIPAPPPAGFHGVLPENPTEEDIATPDLYIKFPAVPMQNVESIACK